MGYVLVTGAGGFIGGHLVKRLIVSGNVKVKAVDIKPLNLWHQVYSAAENIVLDLSDRGNCYSVMAGVDSVYNLAADMGGIGFIENHKTACMLNVLINTHLLLAARDNKVKSYFFSSSACVYSQSKQLDCDNPGLKESDAYPAMPEDGYGWEKLFSERMCRHFREDFGIATKVFRFHNVYGPFGSFEGGREKAPAAICRKIIDAKLSGKSRIEIWGDGKQTRSFMYIDDCIEGLVRLMESDVAEPLNLGSAELVSINQLVAMVEAIAGVTLEKTYLPQEAKGVRGRNSDNRMIRDLLHWEPSISLQTGLEKTYTWIHGEMKSRYGIN
ncbi:MAG: NAD-dependent epimerase/dehydratase family protein [Puniceicoccales bacterium]|jgi:nucleoside-diphosphate-sugar epimerase|nr:NAD-dependent epimerase/dehydratase family protein [Puniceicoccales bacterium]